MKVFVAGATGAIGRFLMPQLLAAGHAVIGMTRSEQGARAIRSMGAEAVVADVFDPAALNAAMARVLPDAVIHQLTAIPKVIDRRRLESQFGETNRLRTTGTRNLLEAASDSGARRFLAQSVSFAYAPIGAAVKTEEDLLYAGAPPKYRPLFDAVASLERQVLGAEAIEGVVVRYGFFYGPGTAYASDGSVANLVRKRRFPVVGGGRGVYSFIHLADAAAATVAALGREWPNVYNVVDDEPAEVRWWLPIYADALGAKKPFSAPAWLGRLAAGEYALYLMTEQRGASNVKAKAELGWAPRYPSWRQGFREALG